MTADQLRACLDQLGWTTVYLAERAKVSPVTARRWLNGRLAIPDNVARTLDTMAELAEQLAQKPIGSRG